MRIKKRHLSKIRNLLSEKLSFFPTLIDKAFPSRIQKRFVQTWTDVLSEHAGLYTGLYAGLARVKERKTRAPEKMLREWYDRTRFQWEDGGITRLCENTLKQVIERADPAECAEYAALLLRAADDAGIRREEAETLTLDNKSAAAYTEWNGEDLFVGDTVRIITPAWYQNGALREQGFCTLEARGEG